MHYRIVLISYVCPRMKFRTALVTKTSKLNRLYISSLTYFCLIFCHSKKGHWVWAGAEHGLNYNTPMAYPCLSPPSRNGMVAIWG